MAKDVKTRNAPPNGTLKRRTQVYIPLQDIIL